MEIESDGEKIDLIKIAEEILAIHPSKRTLINSLHSLVIQFQAHLDTIIKRYKIMSITLVAATVGAVGFSFSGEIKDVHVNKLIMSSIVCVFGMIGLAGIWYLDIQVFHKFWGSFFVEEVKMEEKHHFLVDVGDVAISLDNIKARLVGDGNWYIFLNIILSTAAGTALSFVWTSILIKFSIFIGAGFFAFCVSSFMIRTSNKLLNVVEKMLKINKGN